MPSSEDGLAARRLVKYLSEDYPGGWDQLMIDAGVKPLTAQGWRYEGGQAKKTPTNPSGANLVKLLRAVGLLNEHFQPIKGWRALASQAAADEAVRRTETLAEQPPTGRRRRAEP